MIFSLHVDMSHMPYRGAIFFVVSATFGSILIKDDSLNKDLSNPSPCAKPFIL